MRTTSDTGSGLTPSTGPMRRLGAGVAALAVVIALAPSGYAAAASQPAHSSGGPAAVAAKKKCKKGFKLNKHNRCVRKSGSSPVY